MVEPQSIDDLIDYIGARQPHLLDGMEGATSDAIQRLEDAAEAATGLAFPFSEAYLAFLRRMGRHTPISFAYDARMDVTSLAAVYRRILHDPAVAVPGTLVVGAYGRTVEQVLLEIEVDSSGKLATGQVLTRSGGTTQVAADSFLGFLSRRAFEEVAGAHLPIAGLFAGQTAEFRLTVIADAAERLGFRSHGWSDAVTYGAETPGAEAVLYAEQPLGEPAWIRIEAQNRKLVVALGERIRPAAEARFERFIERSRGLQHRIDLVLATGARAR